MTDKEKFRKKVEKLKSNLIHGACSSQVAMETRCKEEAYNEVLAILDSTQEVPISKEWIEELRTKLDSMSKEEFEQVWEKYRVEEEEEPVSEELEEAAHRCYESNDKFMDGFKKGANWQKQKDSIVSEELEEASMQYAKLKHKDTTLQRIVSWDFKAGAKWQKKQMMANTADAMIGLPYENKDGGYTHLIDVSRPLPVGNNKIAIIFKED